MTNIKKIDEGIPYGVYIWEINGKPVVNENRDYLIAPARRGDLAAIRRLTNFVQREYEIFEGGPVFKEGVRPISEHEWEDQMARMQAGEEPDQYDLGSLIDTYNYQKGLDGK